MKKLVKNCGIWLLSILLVLAFAGSFAASEDDNSLSSLGIITEGVTVEPEFSASTWTVTATVPAGTTQLELDPVPTAASATVTDISGTTLGEDGTGTVYITVQSANGSDFTYTVNVVTDQSSAAAAQTETQAQTEPQTQAQTETETETEPQTEDSQYVRVDKNTIQEAEDTITALKGEISTYRDTITLYTRIMYVLIAVAVILLFVVINLILRRHDMKAELNDYRSLGYSVPAQGKEKNGRGPASNPAPRQEPGQAGRFDETDLHAGGAGSHAGRPQDSSRRENYGGLDVQPQTSKKKGRNLPAYETPAAGKAEPSQRQGSSAGVQGGGAQQMNAPRRAAQGRAPQQTNAPRGAAQGHTAQQTNASRGAAQGQQTNAPGAAQGRAPQQAGSPQSAGQGRAAGTGRNGQPNHSGSTPQEQKGKDVEIDLIDL